MAPEVGLQAAWFAISLGFGAGLRFFYDLLAPFRRRRVGKALADLVFLLGYGYALLYLLLAVGRGIFQAYEVLGLALGALAWHRTVGPPLAAFCTRPVVWAAKIFRKIEKFLFSIGQKWFTIVFIKSHHRSIGGPPHESAN